MMNLSPSGSGMTTEAAEADGEAANSKWGSNQEPWHTKSAKWKKKESTLLYYKEKVEIVLCLRHQ